MAPLEHDSEGAVPYEVLGAVLVLPDHLHDACEGARLRGSLKTPPWRLPRRGLDQYLNIATLPANPRFSQAGGDIVFNKSFLVRTLYMWFCIMGHHEFNRISKNRALQCGTSSPHGVLNTTGQCRLLIS